jgi:hypothetical protein
VPRAALTRRAARATLSHRWERGIGLCGRISDHGGADPAKHGARIGEYLLVAEANHADAHSRQCLAAENVMLALTGFIVDATSTSTHRRAAGQ